MASLSARLSSELTALRSAKSIDALRARSGAMSDADLSAAQQQLGLRMASLSTLVRCAPAGRLGWVPLFEASKRSIPSPFSFHEGVLGDVWHWQPRPPCLLLPFAASAAV